MDGAEKYTSIDSWTDRQESGQKDRRKKKETKT
jgi:hypothetical protein